MAEAVAPQVFTRRASGLVRVMSPYSAFVYNILTMGIIFPWVFMQAPTAFQGSNLVLAILFAFVFELPIAMAYVWLATALPRSGGDYVFQSRVFGAGSGSRWSSGSSSFGSSSGSRCRAGCWPRSGSPRRSSASARRPASTRSPTSGPGPRAPTASSSSAFSTRSWRWSCSSASATTSGSST